MRAGVILVCAMMVAGILSEVGRAQEAAKPGALKVHAIFNSNMVIQRGKPIKVWGWAKPGEKVSVQLGKDKAEAAAVEGKGRWEVTFPAREASAEPQDLIVMAGTEKSAMTNVVVGDVWVMNGQSNMALPLGKIQHSDMESAQANLPMLRFFSIAPNEQSELIEDIQADKITTGGWAVSTPETAREFSAIGYVFGARLQRTLNIPIGLIKNARGGASIESLVPRQMFDKDPVAKRYAESVEKRIAEFNPEAEADVIWGRQKGRAKAKGQPEPPRPDPKNLTSWNVPGKSPSDMASVYNGMFGVFKGYNIKGVLFHQGYNNAISGNCRPKRYRALMKLMVEGWREDFNDPDLPVGIIEFCAGGTTQNEDNFESLSNEGGPYIREAQRFGLADVANQKNLMFLPGYDVQIPGLHPSRKREHGERAARWALSQIYAIKGIRWDSAKLVSAEPRGDMMVVTFDKRIKTDDGNSILEGFALAGEDGKFYMAHARYEPWAKEEQWTKGHKTIQVWSPLVKKPVVVRYGWATSPMGNLKVDGHQDMPIASFRTDSWDFPESDDPAVSAVDRAVGNQRKEDSEARLEERKLKEAAMAKEILEKLKAFSNSVAEVPEEESGD
jgi:sialate O-acetylesterase